MHGGWISWNACRYLTKPLVVVHACRQASSRSGRCGRPARQGAQRPNQAWQRGSARSLARRCKAAFGRMAGRAYLLDDEAAHGDVMQLEGPVHDLHAARHHSTSTAQAQRAVKSRDAPPRCSSVCGERYRPPHTGSVAERVLAACRHQLHGGVSALQRIHSRAGRAGQAWRHAHAALRGADQPMHGQASHPISTRVTRR